MRFSILAALVAVVLISGCGTDVASVRAQIESAKQTVATLAAASAQLQAAAESSKSPEVIAAAGAAQKALELAQQKIPEMEAELAKLDAAAPPWKVALAAAWPFVLFGLRFIPVVGGALAPVAEAAWSMYATKAQKLADKGTV